MCGSGLSAQWALALLPDNSLFPAYLLYPLLLLMAFRCLLALNPKFPPQFFPFVESFKDMMTAFCLDPVLRPKSHHPLGFA